MPVPVDALDDGARLTPVPDFDLGAFARAAESGLHAVAENGDRETLPPPPLHPATLPPPAPAPSNGNDRAPDGVSAGLAQRLADMGRRAEVLATTLRVGALGREEAARVLRTELEALELAARRERLEPLRAAALRLRDVIEELGGIAGESVRLGRDVLVLDTNLEDASSVAIALEASGHAVRVASTPAQLARLASEARCELLFVAIDFPGADPSRPFCRWVRELVGGEGVSVVLYGRASELRLASIGERAEADAALRIDMGVDDLIDVVGDLVNRLGELHRLGP